MGNKRHTAAGVAWAVAVGVRLLAAAVFLFGPYTDEPSELEGWDAARFQAIADAEGRHWADHRVEYPPGSVLLIEAMTGAGDPGDVVRTNRLLVLTSLVVDLGVAAVLAAGWERRIGLAYLLLGTAMVPAGLLRFDLWAAAGLATALVSLRQRPSTTRVALFAGGVVVGAMIKVWPAIVIPVAFAAGRRREAVAACAGLATAAVAWLAYGGVDAIDQVTSLRGATGWHVESVFGSLTVLFTDAPQRFEFDVYRIGTLREPLVLGGRVLTVAVVVGLAWLVHRRHADRRHRASDDREISVEIATALVGGLAALIVSAPLLSPQFLLWLTVPAAVMWGGEPPHRRLVSVVAIAIVLTAIVLASFGPPNLDHPLPAIGLLLRDAVLVGSTIGSFWLLRQPSRSVPPA